MAGKLEKSTNQVVSKTTPNKETNNKKRKEPEQKIETTKTTETKKTQTEKPKTTDKDSNKKTSENNTTKKNTTENKKIETEKPATTDKDSIKKTSENNTKTKQPQAKKQKSEPTTQPKPTTAPTTTPTKPTTKPTTTTTTTTTTKPTTTPTTKPTTTPTTKPTTPTTAPTTKPTTKSTTKPTIKPTTTTEPTQPQQSTFSIFDSLKKSNAVSTTSDNKTVETKKTTTPSKKTTTITTTDKSNEKESSSSLLLKAFSTDNQYSEPNIKEIDEKIDDVLKEIQETSGEISRKDQKDKAKLKADGVDERKKQNPRTVFVSNLNLEFAKDSELRQLFKEFGQIETIRFRSIPLSKIDGNRKETFIKKQFHEKRETCNAYIVFKQINDAKKAVKEMNGKEAFGKHLRVDMADHKPSKESDAKTIFIGNIPYETEEEELFLIFDKAFGKVVSLRIVRDSFTNIGKGFGYVNFSCDKAATAAIDHKTIEFNGREIRIFPTKENPKKGKTIKEKKKLLNKKPSTRGQKSNDQE